MPQPCRFDMERLFVDPARSVVSAAYIEDWGDFSNGDLLAVAEGRFALLSATGTNLRRQQDLRRRTLATAFLTPSRRWLGWSGR
jgi:hypothetical protein